MKLVAQSLLLGYCLPARLRKSVHTNLREEQINLAGGTESVSQEFPILRAPINDNEILSVLSFVGTQR